MNGLLTIFMVPVIVAMVALALFVGIPLLGALFSIL